MDNATFVIKTAEETAKKGAKKDLKDITKIDVIRALGKHLTKALNTHLTNRLSKLDNQLRMVIEDIIGDFNLLWKSFGDDQYDENIPISLILKYGLKDVVKSMMVNTKWYNAYDIWDVVDYWSGNTGDIDSDASDKDSDSDSENGN